MSSADANNTGWRGTDQGTQLKESGSSGFQALLSGYRYYHGTFFNMGSYAYFWSSSQCDAADAWSRNVSDGYTGVIRDNNYKTYGFCARCLKNWGVETSQDVPAACQAYTGRVCRVYEEILAGG